MKIFLTILLLSTFDGKTETLNQLRTRANTWLTNHVPNLVARQNTYASNHGGKFWQGLITHSVIPTHTTTEVGDAPVDRLTFHPTDVGETWGDLFPEYAFETFPAAAVVDVYDGPQGKGWFFTVYLRHNGVIYQRRKGFGPDVSMDFDWRVYNPLTE